MKRILLFLLFFVSAFTFSETLENVSYNNGKVIGTFREQGQIKPNASVTKVGAEEILMLSFPDSEIGLGVPTYITRNDQYKQNIYSKK